MPENPRTLLCLRKVQNRVPFSRSTIYAKIRSGDFPSPVKISENRIAWDSEVIDQWIAEKLAAA